MPSSTTHELARHFADFAAPETADLPSLRQALSAVPDPRAKRGVRYPFTDVLLVFVAAVLAGARSLTMVAEWAGRAHRNQNLFERGSIPSLATLHRIASMTDPVSLDAAVSAWTASHARAKDTGLRAVAVDGKEVRGSKRAGGDRVFLMAALDHDSGAVLAQEAIGTKTNEIPHLPLLLTKIGDLDGVVVTADALHTLAVQAEAIVAHGGHYVFTVKGNQPRLQERIAGQGWSGLNPGHTVREKAHGRTSSWETTIRPAHARIGFPHAAQTARIIRGRAEHGSAEKTGEQVYVITSLPPALAGAQEIHDLVRGHWGIENRLHWVRDTAYNEDKSQVRMGHGAHIMATLRNLAINALRLAGQKEITATLRALDHEPELLRHLTGL